ncbi:MAG: hypothetical protein ACOYMB_01635 [Patescibacteria group bacterium]
MELISEKEQNQRILKIAALDGSKTISKSPNIFSGRVALSVKNHGLVRSIITGSTILRAHALPLEKSLSAGFIGIDAKKSLEKKWVTQNQIVEFFENLPSWASGRDILLGFLCKRKETMFVDEKYPSANYFIIYIDPGSPGFPVYDCEFTSRVTWSKMLLIIPD